MTRRKGEELSIYIICLVMSLSLFQPGTERQWMCEGGESWEEITSYITGVRKRWKQAVTKSRHPRYAYIEVGVDFFFSNFPGYQEEKAKIKIRGGRSTSTEEKKIDYCIPIILFLTLTTTSGFIEINYRVISHDRLHGTRKGTKKKKRNQPRILFYKQGRKRGGGT